VPSLAGVRRGELLPLLLIASSFGPYVFKGLGVRLEQVIIYALLPLVLVLLLAGRQSFLCYKPVAKVLAILVFVTLWTLLVTTLAGRYESVTKAISHFEHYLRPIAVLLLVSVMVKLRTASEAQALFNRSLILLIWMLCLNTTLSICSVFLGLSWVTDYFVASPGASGSSVAELAASNGRFSGVFDQPAEAGIAYSLGLFSWAYLRRTNSKVILLDYVALTLILVGGALSVSKVFVIGGILLFLAYWNPLKRPAQLLNWRSTFLVVIASTSLGALLSTWKGLDFLLRLFMPGDQSVNMVALYTAGRFGKDETLVKELFAQTIAESPFYGMGFAANTTLDNAYAEFFVQGGLIGLLAYISLLIVIGTTAFFQPGLSKEDRRFLGVLVLFITAAGMGMPIVTANRVSSILWVLVFLVFFVAYQRRRAICEIQPQVNPGR
jgi:hypothetical protein